MTHRLGRWTPIVVLSTGLAMSGCGGGGGGGDARPGGSTPPPPAVPTATTAGLWKGTISSDSTGQSAGVVALTAADGQSVWMTTDGRVWQGQVPAHADRYETTFAGHMYAGAHFPDGTNHGPSTFSVDHHSATATGGHHSGNGDRGSFELLPSPMWDRPASLETLAGVYTRTTSTGYAITLSIDANGQVHGSDSTGCVFDGTVHVPDPAHDLYGIEMHLSSCGTLDGDYRGMGTLLDADAMHDWMTGMTLLEHGRYAHGGPGMPGMGGQQGGHNTVPTGHHNLFMFGVANDRTALMDALAR